MSGGTDSLSRQDAEAFSGRAGLAYQFDNGIVPYISYSTSFEPVSGLDYNGRAFDPTTGKQYEAGIKYKPTDWNGLLTLSWYDLTQQNVTTNDPDHTGYSIQQGEIRSRGIELEAKGEIAMAGASLQATRTRMQRSPRIIPTVPASVRWERRRKRCPITRHPSG